MQARLVVKGRAASQGRFVGRWVVVVGLALTMVACVLTTIATATSASAGSAAAQPKPPAEDADTLTPRQLADQIKAAGVLRAGLMRSSAEVASASSRLERLAAQANTLLSDLSTARIAETAAQAEAAAQRARMKRLGVEVQQAQDDLGRLASDSYIRGGGPLGDLAAIVEALTAPSPEQSTDSIATVQYLMNGRVRKVDRLTSLRAAQALTSARAAAASTRAAAAAKQAATAKSALDTVIVDQRSALNGFRIAQTDQIGRAGGVRGALLRSEDAVALEADRQLAEALKDQGFVLPVDEGSSCGKGTKTYPNGRLPASALCPLYAAPGESLSRDASLAFNAMSKAYQRQGGSPLCVTDGYRSYAEQVAVRLQSPTMTATPGRSQHGLGLAVDLCGGVQSFAGPAHLWMQRNAPLYGWFHPSWAEPSGVMPEPWHWEFAS